MKLLNVSITKNYTKFCASGMLNPLYELDITCDCFMDIEMIKGFLDAKDQHKVFDKEGFPYTIGQLIIR